MPNLYLETKSIKTLPRLPLEGNIDLTYRCNNNCRHCWIRIPAKSIKRKEELSFQEIRKIADDARKLGCRRWSISGGEPMLRPDFIDIFDYLTSSAISYSINTNGTLITPGIARVMKRKGAKMVALYGATAKVHDHITRNPGSYEAVMRGMAYLKEAGAGFIVQLIPMRDNYHQFKKMTELAQSLSPHYRVGAAWLYLSACGDVKRNKEILRQRLSPRETIELDKPDLSSENNLHEEEGHSYCSAENNKYLFSNCISYRRDFHVDPYGCMTFCCYIKDPSLRYNLRNGNFQEAWEQFIPSLAGKIKTEGEYSKDCGTCELKNNCRSCPVYGYLEHGRFSAKVGYLCKVAKENKKYKDMWSKQHRRYYQIGGMTLQIDSDLPIAKNTFDNKFRSFEVDGQGDNPIILRHHFFIPDIFNRNLGVEIYRKPPWAIYKKQDSWIYLGISPDGTNKGLHQVAVFNNGHTRGRIYNDKEDSFVKGGLHSLTLFPTDQILLARILVDRQGLYIHACGVNFCGKGLLFVGHSEAGKSTMANMLKDKAQILCDDRVIIRHHADGFNIYGTWSHGDVPIVSPQAAPLKAVFFIEKDVKNKIVQITDKKQISKKMLEYIIKPFVTTDWWNKTLCLIDSMVNENKFYMLYFDKSGKVVEILNKI